MTGKENVMICRCEDVSIEDVERVIDEGYSNLEEIKRLLRCGMGPCQGRTCLILIARILSRKMGKPLNEMEFPRVRSPIRPVPIATFTGTKPK